MPGVRASFRGRTVRALRELDTEDKGDKKAEQVQAGFLWLSVLFVGGGDGAAVV